MIARASSGVSFDSPVKERMPPDIAAHAKRVIYLRDGLIWRDEMIVQTRANPGKAAAEPDLSIAFPFTIAPRADEPVKEPVRELEEVFR